MTALPTLPITPLLPEMCARLRRHAGLVLQAPPGAGKTTLAPLALLGEPWLAGRRVIMLEPRRLAARTAARRLASLAGDALGQTVGYRMKLDSRVGPATRLLVVTEGVLVRMIQADPALGGVGAVIFDEFHERSLDADLGLALCLEARAALRPDLRLIVMSATLDGQPVARLLGDAPLLTSQGRAFAVTTIHDPPRRGERLEAAVARTAIRALAEQEGDILVFLPGVGEIRRAAAALAARQPDPAVMIVPLYGDLSRADQDRALAPAPPGKRKLVLATAVAETSLTIEGVRVVIDAGLMRAPRFDPNSGMTRLETLRVSRASADQRRGRAGRLGPGVCYRLWPKAEGGALKPFSAPEISQADLAPLALELARWGTRDAAALAWLDPPPAAHLAQARDLLRRLGALDENDAITRHGAAMAELPMHPRLAHMVLRARNIGLGGLACDLAALLSERDGLKARDCDMRRRLEMLHAGEMKDIRRTAAVWRKRLGVRQGEPQGGIEHTGLLLAFAYPDRIAARRGAPGRFRLAGGRGAIIDAHDPLAGEPFIAAASLDGAAREARVFLAAPLSRAELENHFSADIRHSEIIAWDARAEAVSARRQRRLGALVLEDTRLDNPDPQAVMDGFLAGVRQMGLGALPWTRPLEAWRARLNFLGRLEPDAGWPAVDDAALLEGLEHWLGPFCLGMTRRADLKNLDLAGALRAMLTHQQARAVDRLAPSHVTVPSGSRIAIDYGADPPVLAVRLQEMFGASDTPRIAGGQVALTLHLLSPANRVVQITGNLAGFWSGAYKAVKADMKGRYPKHFWPDDPHGATATRRAKRRG
jgi:ATP-dependent helicase HrpB